jgi:hypothetical protein
MHALEARGTRGCRNAWLAVASVRMDDARRIRDVDGDGSDFAVTEARGGSRILREAVVATPTLGRDGGGTVKKVQGRRG